MKKVLAGLRNLCAKREYCVFDVKEKALKAMDGNASAAADIVASLVKDGFVDNRRYASAFAREKSAISGWGKNKIRYALSLKKVTKDDIEYAVSEIDSGKAEARMEAMLARKRSALKNDPQWKLKLLRFALGRGYEYDEIMKAIAGQAETDENTK